MKTLQELILENPYNTITEDPGDPNKYAFYQKLARHMGTVQNEDRVLYLHRITLKPRSGADLLTTSIFSLKLNEDVQPGVAYTTWKELLGYQVSDESLQAFGDQTVLRTILRDMTTYGTHAQDAEQARQEFMALYEKIKGMDNLEDIMDAFGLDEDMRDVYTLLLDELAPDSEDRELRLRDLRPTSEAEFGQNVRKPDGLA